MLPIVLFPTLGILVSSKYFMQNCNQWTDVIGSVYGCFIHWPIDQSIEYHLF